MKTFNDMQRQMIGAAGAPPPMPGGPGGPPSLLGPNGQPMPPSMPQTGQGGNVPGGQPVAGGVPGPMHGMPRPAYPARGPGASPMDLMGRPAA